MHLNFLSLILLFIFFDSLNFQDPSFRPGFIYESKLLPHVTMPPPTLKPWDMRFGNPGSFRPQVSDCHVT